MPVNRVIGQGSLFALLTILTGNISPNAHSQTDDYEVTPLLNADFSEQQVFTFRAPDCENCLAEKSEGLQQVTNTVASVDMPIGSQEARKELRETGIVRYRSRPWLLGMGSRANLVEKNGAVLTADIKRENAEWLRLQFSEISEETDLQIIIVDPASGDKQIYTPDLLNEWNYRSGFVYGDQLRILVSFGADSSLDATDVSLKDLVSHIHVGNEVAPDGRPQSEGPDFEEAAGSGDRSDNISADEDNEQAYCDEDDRQLTSHEIYGRMQPKYCTVFRVEQNIFASAGHCFRTRRDDKVVVFNIPPSDENGDPQHPAPLAAHTFPVITSSLKCSDCTQGEEDHRGNDWAIFTLGRNTEPPFMTAEEKYNFPDEKIWVANSKAADWTSMTLYGFGWDDEPSEHKFALQKSSGPIDNFKKTTRGGIKIQHYTDTEDGASGAPIYATRKETPAETYIVGIHNGGKCNPAAGIPNHGTAFSSPRLQEHIKELRAELAAIN
ncbi:MAG: trypsin-like serine protease [Pseudomonadota bacterium]